MGAGNPTALIIYDSLVDGLRLVKISKSPESKNPMNLPSRSTETAPLHSNFFAVANVLTSELSLHS
ncbi:MAG: hypothetical protein ACI85S_000775 [Pseudohongiellaceae bacterium]|jgi:hypothetical protein